MKKITLLVLAFGLVCVLLFNQIFYNKNSTTSNNQKVSLRLSWLHQASFAGYYMADKLGFYKKEGLDVKINPGGIDAPSIQLVAGGSDQFGQAGANEILLAREKGIPVVPIAIIFQTNPVVWFSLKKSGIDSVQKFVGKKIGVILEGDEDSIYRMMLQQAKVNRKDLTEVPLKYNLTPLLTGQIDVAVGTIFNEELSIEEQGYETNIIWPIDYGIDMYGYVLFTTEDMIKNKPEIVKKFVKATMLGWMETIKNPEQAVTYTLQYNNKLTKKHETGMLKRVIPLVNPNNSSSLGLSDYKKWETMQEIFIKQGVMKKKIDINKAFTNSFVQ